MTPDSPLAEVQPPVPVSPSSRWPAWTLKDVFLIAAVFFIASLVSATFVLIVARLLPAFHGISDGKIATSPLVFLPIQFFAYLITFVFTRFFIASRAEEDFWRAVKWNFPGLEPAITYAAMGIFLAVLVQIAGRFLPIPEKLPVEQYFRAPQFAYMMLIFGILVAPIVEETYFRGLLYPALKRVLNEPLSLLAFGLSFWTISILPLVYVALRFRKVSTLGVGLILMGVLLILISLVVKSAPKQMEWLSEGLAIGITALGFALVHQSQLAHAWAPLMMLFGVGLALTVVRARTNSLAASWIIHCAYNSTLFAALLIGTHGFHNLPQ